MYSNEIDNIIKKYNYNLPSSIYCQICRESNQIWHVRNENGWYRIETNDGYNWLVLVHPD